MGREGSMNDEKTITSKPWRDIVDSLTDALLVLSASCEPITINSAGATLLGISHPTAAQIRELMGRNDWLAKMVNSCLETGQNLNHAGGELEIAHRSIPVRTAVSPLQDPRGKIRGVVILIYDSSYERGLGHRFAGEYGEAQLGLSPAGLAHEIKNPLTGIRGAAELLARLLPGDVRVQQYCSVITEGTERLTSLVEQVLSVSAPARLRKEPVNIHKVLHQAMALAGAGMRPAVKVEQLFDPSLPEVSGDSAALERVFLNLIKNAYEAIGERGVLRLLTRMETEFHLSEKGHRRQFLRVEVSDSGIGLAPAELGQLFTPFFTTKPNGTGLGLVLSQRIIALHGGRLWAEPAEDKVLTGMTFKVSLPVEASRHGA